MATAHRSHHAYPLHQRGIGPGRGIARDVVAQQEEDALAELRGGDSPVAGEDQALHAHLRPFDDAEHHLFRPVARHHPALRDLHPQKSGADVEATQPRRHLLCCLCVERVVGVEKEVRCKHDVGEGAVSAQVELDDGPRGDRHHQVRASRSVLDTRGIDACAKPPCAPVAVADAADGIVQRGEVEHVAGIEPERGRELFRREAEIPFEPDCFDARHGAFVDAQLEGNPAGSRLAHRRDLRVPIADPEVGGADRLHGGSHLLGLELGVYLKVRVLQQDALGERLVAHERDGGELLDRGEHEHDADPPVAHRLRIGGHAREPCAGVQRADRVPEVAGIEGLARLHADERAHGFHVGALVRYIADPRGLDGRRLRQQQGGEDREHLVALPLEVQVDAQVGAGAGRGMLVIELEPRRDRVGKLVADDAAVPSRRQALQHLQVEALGDQVRL